jgi:hypothetical protein
MYNFFLPPSHFLSLQKLSAALPSGEPIDEHDSLNPLPQTEAGAVPLPHVWPESFRLQATTE